MHHVQVRWQRLRPGGCAGRCAVPSVALAAAAAAGAGAPAPQHGRQGPALLPVSAVPVAVPPASQSTEHEPCEGRVGCKLEGCRHPRPPTAGPPVPAVPAGRPVAATRPVGAAAAAAAAAGRRLLQGRKHSSRLVSRLSMQARRAWLPHSVAPAGAAAAAACRRTAAARRAWIRSCCMSEARSSRARELRRYSSAAGGGADGRQPGRRGAT